MFQPLLDRGGKLLDPKCEEKFEFEELLFLKPTVVNTYLSVYVLCGVGCISWLFKKIFKK